MEPNGADRRASKERKKRRREDDKGKTSGAEEREKRHREDDDKGKTKKRRLKDGTDPVEPDGRGRDGGKDRDERLRKHEKKDKGHEKRKHITGKHHHRPHNRDKGAKDKDIRDDLDWSGKRDKGAKDKDITDDLDWSWERWAPSRNSEDESHELKSRGTPTPVHRQSVSEKKGAQSAGKRKDVGRSAWLKEEATSKHHSPVTLSDIEFSIDNDSRVINREFHVAEDYVSKRPKVPGPVC